MTCLNIKEFEYIWSIPKIEAYIQPPVLKKTLESISFERRRGIEEEDGHNEVDALVNKIAVTSIEVQPTDIQQ